LLKKDEVVVVVEAEEGNLLNTIVLNDL